MTNGENPNKESYAPWWGIALLFLMLVPYAGFAYLAWLGFVLVKQAYDGTPSANYALTVFAITGSLTVAYILMITRRIYVEFIAPKFRRSRNCDNSTEEFMEKVFCCATEMGIVAEHNRIVPTLPLELRMRIHKIWTAYLVSGGIELIFERFNNRSIGTILAEFEEVKVQRPIVAGEIDGVRFALHEAPDKSKESDGP